jgi:hypothetical protein
MIFLYVWIGFIGSKNPPIDRKVSNVALSATARSLAAGTVQGKIAVWDETSDDGPPQNRLLPGFSVLIKEIMGAFAHRGTSGLNNVSAKMKIPGV